MLPVAFAGKNAEVSVFTVSRDCVDLGLRSGAIVLRNVSISDTNPELRAMIVAEVQAIRSQGSQLADVRSTPEIVGFCEILKRVGVRPRKQPPSVQRLYKYLLKRGDLPSVNSLVDAYNLMSVRTKCSMGAHDLDRIAIPVELRLFGGDETFTPLGSNEAAAVIAGEYGYVDAENRVLCRLDLLQAEFSKVTSRTSNVLLIIEGTTSHAPETVRRAFTDTITLVRTCCGGEADIVALPDFAGQNNVR